MSPELEATLDENIALPAFEDLHDLPHGIFLEMTKVRILTSATSVVRETFSE